VDAGMEISDANSYSRRYTSPEENMERSELKSMLEEAIDQLTEKERSVILFYYYEDLTVKEIAQVMEVTESRVSQLHTKALQKMKKVMGEYVGILAQLA
jgi:RNA polymerase sigma factor for flagellar operon FliA